jgi:hypothetical protein
MTNRPETASGISKVELPKVLPYNKIPSFEPNSALKDIFCYIIEHYGNNGISVLVYRQKDRDQVVTIFGDWDGNNIDIIDSENNEISKLCMDFSKTDLVKIIETMRLINIEQSQFFFGIDEQGLILCDIQVSINKMVGPGMIKDIFGKVLRTQRVIKTEILDERSVDAIMKGNGSYQGNLIIKPSRFRLNHISGGYVPLYAEVVR